MHEIYEVYEMYEVYEIYKKYPTSILFLSAGIRTLA